MAQSETVDRILDAAEYLFAEKGFAETSLRTITSKAGVNLAAVNYHFGSKKALIQAVFTRFLDPFCSRLAEEVAKIPKNKEPSLEELLRLLVDQILATKPRGEKDLAVFMRLLALAFTETQGHLRRYLQDIYGDVLSGYLKLVVAASPALPRNELFWRIHFMMGTVIFSMSGFEALKAIADYEYGEKATIEQTLHRMEPFLAAAMRAQLDS
ncbi:MAG: TetR family transcriptional regulator [Oceanospirillales bacterium LUC14_002_19_P2]|nr:MAG: TetR family transcriptional regulator [Oceanospirillales bacterium LUC14_002_19_P2]